MYAIRSYYVTLETPILLNEELDKIASLNEDGFKTKVLSIAFDLEAGLEKGLENLFAKSEEAIEEGNNILILSDREIGENEAPIPSLLATAALHHHLIKARKRNGVDLVVETAEARDVMHFALLIGYGALAVNPYLALEAIDYMVDVITSYSIHYTKLYDDEIIRKGSKRVYIWSRSIPILKDCLLLGFGPDTYSIVFPSYNFV